MKWILGLGFLILFSGEVVAAPQCNDRDSMLEHLENKYKEAVVGMGVTPSGALIELITSEKGETWTIVLSMGNGVTCLLASGENWKSKKWELEGART